jgi:hypothetical protein
MVSLSTSKHRKKNSYKHKKNGENSLGWCHYKVQIIVFQKMIEYIELEYMKMKELEHATKNM